MHALIQGQKEISVSEHNNGEVLSLLNYKYGFIYYIAIFTHLVFTLNVQELNYSGLTRTISWLLMPWFFCHQVISTHDIECKIGRSLSHMGKDFKYLCHVSVEETVNDHIFSEKFSTLRVNTLGLSVLFLSDWHCFHFPLQYKLSSTWSSCWNFIHPILWDK